ncbi:MAG: nucleotide exchange factor GrpE [Oscillospiraceae bacterium]
MGGTVAHEQEEKRPEETTAEEQKAPETAEPVQTEQPAPEAGEAETDPLLTELEALKDQAAQQEDKYLRLAAEYDNYRRRTTKEKESIWNDAKADAALAFLPVYDNLERALKQETADEAYKKGVEMTMTQLRSVLEKLGITEIPALGQPFDPTLHNAVMHVEDESLGENTVAEVFQAGFKLGDKVIRFSMVKVAN